MAIIPNSNMDFHLAFIQQPDGTFIYQFHNTVTLVHSGQAVSLEELLAKFDAFKTLHQS